MKILSLNVRGLGVTGKFSWVKNLSFCEKVDVLALQETRCKFLNERWVYNLWGNNDCGYVQKEAVGKSGGLLLIWDSKSFIATANLCSEFFVAVRGNWIVSGKESIIVCVYGPHKDVTKKLMWDQLNSLVNEVDTAWVLCGNFNEVRESSDRLNCTFHQHRAARFNEFISRNNLIEIPIIGRKFTRISDDGAKFSKLDRFLVSDQFINLWKDLSVIPLDRNVSDHCPLVLRDKIMDYGPKPFKVFDEWFNKEGADDIVINAWNKPISSVRSDCRFRDHLKNVKFALKDWSKNTFGNLENEINSLKARVEAWESRAELGNLNECDRISWMEDRKCWLEKENAKTNMLKQFNTFLTMYI
ncbi:uncharacterized protein [Rutidosis leptorrhynchoides]|uniref:uncharacterized protein n=1 Tax=Rutidosis leptorrhynchoides TaxID=125765 RepID=UPI003A9A62CC